MPLSPEQFIAPVLALILVFLPTLSSAAPDQLAQGRVLIHQKNCATCHEGFPTGAPGPALAGITDRTWPETLQLFIYSPNSVKSGSRMPSFFHRDNTTPARKKETNARIESEIQSLYHYLLSTTSAPQNTHPPAGNPKRGADLYHSVGCVACHAPLGSSELENSVPLFLGKTYSHAALIDYLLEPKTALMPSLKLTRQDAADISAWLRFPDNSGFTDLRKKIKPNDQLTKSGRDLFSSHRCVSCHGSPEPSLLPPLAPIPIKNWTAGCLSPTPGHGIPNYSLTETERHAIRAAAKSPLPKTPAEIIDHTFTVYRCYSCHQRNGKGGPSDARRPYFHVTEQMAESYGDFGNIPPKLDHVGRKLTREWLRKILIEGHGEVRPYLATRMPHYQIPEAEIETLIDALEEADTRTPPIEIDVSGLPRHQRGHYGRDLMGTKGLNCITCHGLKGQRAIGAPVMDLTHTVHRLRPGWFKEVLLDPQSVQPGTLMPPLFLNRKKADQEVEQIWTYLKELDQRRLPDGLLRTGDFELKPAEAGKPIVFRTFLEGVGTHAIAVGFPAGTHVAFDSRTSQWALFWQGRFLDALSTWDDRYATPAKPLSEDIYRFQPEKGARQFNGFRLDPDGVPVFLYTVDGEHIEDSIAPLPSGELQRTLQRAGKITRHGIQLDNNTATFRDEK